MSNRDAGAALATFSLIFGMLSVPCFVLPLPALPAIVLGHIALGHVGRTTTNDARGRAWMGLFLGYLSLVVFGVVAGLGAIGLAVDPEEVIQSPETAVGTPAPSSEQTAPPLPAAAQGPPQAEDVYLVQGDGRYHTFFCRAITDADAQRTRLADAAQAGFRPCDICRPNAR